MSEYTTVKVNDIEFSDELYPRKSINEDRVAQYRENLDELPPVVLSSDYLIVDGYHRVRAHRAEGKSEIQAKVLDVSEDAEVFAEAARRNATHGQPLSRDEKADIARQLYKWGEFTQKEIANIVSMSKGWVSGKTRDIREDEREERREKSYKLYLDYMSYPTQEDVAEELDVSQKTVDNDLSKILKSEDFTTSPQDPEITNVWRFQSCEESYGTDYPGRIPGQIVENLLYYYTEEFDLVIDPMAGGGTTVDVCESMARRYAAFDVNPLSDKNIKQNDITTGIPLEDNSADLIFLDPPYWRLKDDEYVDGSIADQNLPEWEKDMEQILSESTRIAKNNGYIALLIEPFSNSGKTTEFNDLTMKLSQVAMELGLDVKQRVSVPLNFDTFTPQSINDAKEKEYMIDQNRDLVIWSC